MAKFMKCLAILLLITGGIVSAVIANSNPIIRTAYNEYLKADLVVSKSFNIWVLLAGCVGSLFPFGILYSIGKILELLGKIAEPKGMEALTPELPAHASRIEPEPNASIPQPPSLGHVICKKCGEENKPFEKYCRKCWNKL